ncbi:MAG: 3-methylornithine--L-lysine ligase PylC [Desulfitobacterium hafniense]|nr:3-methylornithine--L-lysine ligase PylC [Desulfitobacterium hafniense]
MRVVIVGGKLQGVEAAYLSRQAGWNVVLIDKDKEAPAAGLCDEHYTLNIGENDEELAKILLKADFIVPAIEDSFVLETLVRVSSDIGIPLAFDPKAYQISSSKKKSDLLFAKHGIPAPSYWPKCTLPLIVKPSDLSGSRGVEKISSIQELSDILNQPTQYLDSVVIQEFLEGPSYLIEVIGCKGKIIPLQITDLEMDTDYDCNRVLAPTELEPSLQSEFIEIAAKIGKIIDLNGVMDVEVINYHGSLKVLEIDARLPSQTPTVVFKSSGINILELLYEVFGDGCFSKERTVSPVKSIIYEHISVVRDGVKFPGEHVMGSAGSLRYVEDFFGADEAITNYDRGLQQWVATLIITGSNREEVVNKRAMVLENIRKETTMYKTI